MFNYKGIVYKTFRELGGCDRRCSGSYQQRHIEGFARGGCCGMVP